MSEPAELTEAEVDTLGVACECGCGKPAPIARKTDRVRGYVKGQPMRFLIGHKPQPTDGAVRDRFWSKVIKGDECWLWMGETRTGYGLFYVYGKKRSAHRVSWEWANGPIPDGLVLDHLCRVRNCVNPAHLEPVTNRENLVRGTSLITHCPHGHLYAEANTYIDRRGWRRCRTCRYWQDRKRRRDVSMSLTKGQADE